MPNKLPLEGKTIYLTGTQKVQTVAPFAEQNGAKVKAFPLIQTQEVIDERDAKRLQQARSFDWLIFTSQNAVAVFIAKLERYQLSASDFPCKIAAVGEKTAKFLRTNSFGVDFMPTIYSADQFVKEFQLLEGDRALFLRGSLAKSTIRECIVVEEWTIYETVPCLDYIREFEQSLIAEKEPVVIFASPSAVHTYAKEIVPTVDWRFVKIASIGHITTAVLHSYGVTPSIQPVTYTMEAVIEQLILEETAS